MIVALITTSYEIGGWTSYNQLLGCHLWRWLLLTHDIDARCIAWRCGFQRCRCRKQGMRKAVLRATMSPRTKRMSSQWVNSSHLGKFVLYIYIYVCVCVQQDIDIWMRFQLLQRRHPGRIGCQSTINQHCQAGLLYSAIPQHGAGMNKWVVLPPISPIKQTRGYESDVDTIHWIYLIACDIATFLHPCMDDCRVHHASAQGFYMAIGTSGNQFKNAGVAGRLMSEIIQVFWCFGVLAPNINLASNCIVVYIYIYNLYIIEREREKKKKRDVYFIYI